MDPVVVTTIVELLGKGALLLLEYLKVVAWPLVVIVLAFAYKRTIVDVLSRIREASGFGGKVVLTQRLEHDARELNEKPVPELEQDAADPSAQGEDDPGTVRDDSDDIPAASNVPASATAPSRKLRIYHVNASGDASGSAAGEAVNYWNMMNAWSRLERTAARLGQRLGFSPGPAQNLGFLGGQLLERGLISSEAFELGVRLQELRNRMVHDLDRFVLTDWLAQDFADTAGKLIRIYEDVIDTLEPDAVIGPV
ncbi:hypothetical protein [Microbacterium sp. MYb72]|uniref:hypothetical protein n=1 Tax=Microbacterium sp. MYb72 TaxID=1848693 RepID=UPI0011B052C5|nr:hypothetical protein [Microbacterium sp. MYb72]